MLSSLDLRVPTLLLDQERCVRNIERMVAKARRSNTVFRPHFKTHQSLTVGGWFRERGVECIAVSSLSMASYFADGGWSDITVAFPVNILELDTIHDLAGRISLNLLVVDAGTVDWLDRHLKERVGVFLKIDIGTHRTGIEAHRAEEIDACLSAIHKSVKLDLKGFLSHAGHAYDTRQYIDTVAVYRNSIAQLQTLKMQFEPIYGDLVVSYGDTPSCSIIDDFEGIDEVRPGNFVFYDLMQEQIGSCRSDDIAISMGVPVVAIHLERGEFVVYGGSVHFGKDALNSDEGIIYGRMVQADGDSWSSSAVNCYLSALSQEHGVARAPAHFIETLQVGDVLYFLPVHSCQTAQLMGRYLSVAGKPVDHFAGG